jgi:phosphatidylglycerol:prolipoprotein diacylglycerol transferase
VALPLGTAVGGAFLAERPLVPAIGVFGVLLAYLHVYLRVKRVLVPGGRRQLLADLVAFCLPAFLAVTALLGESPWAMADLAALVIPPGIVILRLGCFLGGCCHGRPAAFGVRYPGRGERVLPLPLFELVAAAALGAALVAAAAAGAPCGTLLPRLFVGYGAYRFVSESFRDAVPRTLGLTKSQALAALAAVAGMAAW